jgi:hypothetical protein
MAMLMAFALAVVLSARAAKPVGVAKAPEPVELTALVTSLMIDLSAPALQWSDLDARVAARWLDATGGSGPPPELPGASMRRVGAVPVMLSGRALPYAHEWSGRKVQGWSLSFWGDQRGPAMMRLRGADQCKQPCTPAGVDAEQVLQASAVNFFLECETPGMRYLRLLAQGKKDAYLLQYKAAAGSETNMLFFWGQPPAALLHREGCGGLGAAR